MKKLIPAFRTLVVCSISLIISLFVVSGLQAQDKDWRPVTPEELQQKAPKVDPDADAEAIFWEVRVDDSSTDGLTMSNYVRVKIFTEKGKEDFSKHDLEYLKGTKIKDIDARVTKPDGSIIVLKPDDVMDHEIVKVSGLKLSAKSFALPGLEVGSIVEYRYREVIPNGSANMRLIFQRDVPIQTISYYVKPFAGDNAMKYFQFHTGEAKFEKDKGGFYRATMTNVPAFKEEPRMLPEDEVRSWIYIYYTADTSKTIDEYWGNVSKGFYDLSKSDLKANDDVKTVTDQVIAGAGTDEEKIHKIFDFVKAQIRNISYADTVTDDERGTVRGEKSASDTLKAKIGNSENIDKLFGAMARAAGFDARIALSGNRDEMFFDKGVPNVGLMLGSSNIAVNISNQWRFFSPGEYFTPYGMMYWVEEDQLALIPDQKQPIWQPIPLSSPERSIEKRSGHFKLLEDGTLVGDATIEFTGQYSISEKILNSGDSSLVKETRLKDLVKRDILSTAEVDQITIENANDPEKPFTYKFKVRVPDYASKTGKRLFFQPNVFERSAKPQFTANTRKSDVYFDYPFSVLDDYVLDLPAGFSLESPDAPAPVKDPQGIGSDTSQISVSNEGSIISYKRQFSFGNGGYLRFPAASYPAIKALFESFNQADVHQLTLKQAAVAGVPTK